MTLLDHYLRAVRMYLPGGAQQDDIISELSEHLLSTIEERESALGRPLTEVEQVALFGEYGSPISVAERYGSTRRGFAFGRQIIGLELFPLYARILALNWSLTIVALIVIPLYQGRSVPWTLQNFLWPLFIQFVLVTVIFACVDRFQARSRRRSSASPNWRFPPTYLQPTIPRWQSVTGGCALGLGAALWALTPFALPVIGGADVPLAYTTSGSLFFWPVLILLLVGVAQRIATFVHPEWTALQAVTRLITNGSAVLLLYPFALSYPYVQVSGVAVDAAAAELLARRINGGIWWMTLAGVSLYWVINAGFHLWLCAQLVRYARRRRAEAIST